MERLEHIGIAVKNLELSNKLFAKLLGREHYKIEEVESEGVRTSFFKIGDIKIELLQATRDDSPIAKFIANRGEGLHHLAFEVNNIQEETIRCEAESFNVLGKPRPGADGKTICFLHPKTTQGVLVELCQSNENQ